MPKQLNVNLSFTADTQQARAQLQDLQNQLTKITANAGNSPLGLTQEISSAIVETTKLQAALQKATTKTGSLDLGAFRQELQKSNLSAEQIASTLTSLGPQGQAAFAQLAQSVSLAEVPIKRTNGLLTEFATTLKNAARWQISSSILHGFMGSLQSAYGYAQDLNESLNNIRIVTGQSVDQMADFAKEANNAAKELSTTTTAYTDAALIFYQQGLDDDQVIARTDVVTKLANVTKDSAEEVSSYMTAIWNNFDDGSHSLEYYADVITALGATTASSSAEIAAGLEKFAAIGETVGLSYEYATSALAAVVANTRQSADSVGNAFKTLFARLQGLKLGDTLEDGVDLNKYSKALNAIGVQILDVNGELKEADTILDETAAKWDNLSKAEQTALAQTVAGTRQYAQFVALMESWDDVQTNLGTIDISEGELQKQQDIYAEGWEAASKRVRAAFQDIYQQLLNDKFFIELSNGIAKVVNSISDITDALGGLKGMIPIISGLFLKMFGSDLTKSINNTIFNIQTFSKSGKQAIYDFRNEWTNTLKDITIDDTMSGSAVGAIFGKQAELQGQVIEKARELAQKNKEITEDERTQVELLMSITSEYGSQYTEAIKRLEIEKQTSQELINQTVAQVRRNNGNVAANGIKLIINKYAELAEKEELGYALTESLRNEFDKLKESGIQDISQITKQIESFIQAADNAGIELGDFKNILSQLGKSSNVEELETGLKQLDEIINEINVDVQGFKTELQQFGLSEEEANQLIKNLNNSIAKQESLLIDSAGKFSTYNSAIEKSSTVIQNFGNQQAQAGEKIVAFGSVLSSFSMTLNTINGLLDTLNNPDSTGWEKFVSILGSVGMTTMMVMSSMKQLYAVLGTESTILGTLIAKKSANLALDKTELGIKVGLKALYKGNAAAKAEEALVTSILDKNIIKLNGARITDVSALSAEQKALLIKTLATKSEIAAVNGATVAQNAFNASLLANPIFLVVAAIGMAVGALALYDRHLKRTREAQQKLNEETIKSNQEKIAEIEKNKDLAKSYNDLYKAYKEGNATKEEMYNKTLELADAYDIEGARLLALQGRYEELNELIKEKRQAEINSEISAQRTIQKAAGNIIDEQEQSGFLGQYKYTVNRTGNIKNLLNDKKFTGFNKIETDTNSYAPGQQKNTVYRIDIDFNDPEQALYNIQKLEETKEKLKEQGKTDSEEYKIISDYLTNDKIKEAIENLKTSSDAIKNLRIENQDLETGLSKSSSFKEFSENVKDFRNNVKDFASDDDITNYIKSLSNEYSDLFLSLEEQKNKLSKNNPIKSYLDSLSPEDLKIALTMVIDENTSKENIDRYIETVKRQIGTEQAFDISELTSKLGTELNDSKITTKERKQINEDVNALRQTGHFDTELLDFENKSLYEQQRILEEINEKQYDLLVQKINMSEEDAKILKIEEEKKELYSKQAEIEKALAGLDTSKIADSEKYRALKKDLEEINKQIKEVTSEKYKIELEVEVANEDDVLAAIDLGVDQFVNDATQLKQVAEIIEDNFRITTENIDVLRAQLPELLNDITASEEGYAQLSKETVQQVIADKKQELTADAEIEKQKIQFQIDRLKHLIANTEKEGKVLQEAAKDGLTLEQTVAKGKTEINEEFGNWLIAEYQSWVSDENNAYTTSVSNAEKAAAARITLISKETEAYKARNRAMLGDMNATVDTNVSSGGYSGESSFSSGYSHTLDDYNYSQSQAERQKEFIKELSEANSRALADYQKELNAFEADYAKIDANLKATTASLDRVASGKAGKASSKKSGGKSKDKKDEKKYDEEFDRYHDINEALKELDHTMKMLDKEQSHLFGPALAESLREENKLIEKQTELLKQKQAIQAEEVGELQGQLAAYGMTFDEETNQIVNYAEVTKQQLTKLNEAVKKYNASAQDEAQKTALETAQKGYEEFKKILTRYDNTLNEFRQSEEDLADAYYASLKNNLDAWETELKHALDTKELERNWSSFFNKIHKDFKSTVRDVKGDMKSIYEQINTYSGKGGTFDLNVNAAKDVMGEIDKIRSGEGSDKFHSISEAQEKLKELNQDIMSSAEAAYQLYEDAWDAYVEGTDQAIDKMDKILDQYEMINDDLDHQAKIIELLYGDQDYADLSKLYDAQSKNLLGELDSLRQQIDFFEERYKHTEELYGKDSEVAQKWKQKWLDSIEELHDKEEEYIEAIKNQALNSIDDIFDKLERRMSGGKTLNWVSQQWEDSLAAAEGYYDEVERIYQLESMEQKWRKAIKDTSSLKYQQQLKVIMDDQMSALEGKTKLSEYDIELAEKRLAVYQAQIALEEAQNNKTSMKLSRDETGNWSYQYMADDDDVSSKQQDLLAKQQEYYEFTKQSQQDLTQKIIETTQTAFDRIKELEEESLNATTERQAEIAEQIEYLKEYYWGEEGILTLATANHAEYERNLNQATAETLWGLYDIDVQNYELMTQSEQELITSLKEHGVNSYIELYEAIAENYDEIQLKCEEINEQSLDTWTTTANEMIRKWNSTDDDDSVRVQVEQALAACDEAVDLYKDKVDEGCEAAGEDFKNVGDRIKEDTEKTEVLGDVTEETINQVIKELDDEEEYLRQVEKAWKDIARRIDEAIAELEEYLKLANQVNDVKFNTSIDTNRKSSVASDAIKSKDNKQNDENPPKNENKVETTSGSYWSQMDRLSVSTYSAKYNGSQLEYTAVANTGKKFYSDSLSDLKKQINNAGYSIKFDTGGYTGDWNGGEGRLAMLHSKELVLNKDDTKNMLTAVESVRQISNLGSSITNSIAAGISKMMSSLLGLGKEQRYETYNKDTTESNNNTFEITMNVDGGDVQEIQQAILNLPNLASQFLSRR